MIRISFSYFFMFVIFLPSLLSQPSIPVDPDTKLITYQEVVNENGSKLELYNRCIEWVNSFYKNVQNVAKVQDPEGGLLVLHHRLNVYDTLKDGTVTKSNTIIQYVLRIEFKDNRYRYTFTEFTMKAQSRYPLERWLDKNDPTWTPQWNSYLAQMDSEIRKIIESLKKGMKPKSTKVDEW